MLIYISPGNKKMGNIASISLPPIITCAPNVPCGKKGCYAKRMMRMPNVKRTWYENYEILTNYPQFYHESIRIYLERNLNIRMFRYHIAGDFISQEYLNEVKLTANKFHDIKFLAFTKQYSFDFTDTPPNLSIVFSMWPEYGIDIEIPKGIYRAWMQDGTETRIPENAIECFGNCASCGMCWNLSSIHRDVWFHKH